MAADIFIKIDGIKGESTDDKHKEDIDVLSWSWGLSQSGTFHGGGGGGAGKVSVGDLSFTKYVDIATPPLLLASSNGKHIKEATLYVRKAGEQPLEYVVIKLEKILVSSVSTGGAGGQDRLTENVTLNFAKVEFKYVKQGDTGAKDSDKTYKWDIQANKGDVS